MIFKNLMPLTLLSVAIFASSAFAQSSSTNDIITVTSGGMGGGTARNLNTGGTGGAYPYGTGGNLGSNFNYSFPSTLGDTWRPGQVRLPPTLRSSINGVRPYDAFMALPGTQKEANCPINSLTCFDNSLPKTYSLQNTTMDLEKYFQTKKAPVDCGYGPNNINLDALSNVIDQVDLPSCYKDRESDLNEDRRDITLIGRDKRACDCLADKANTIDPDGKGLVKILKGGKKQQIKSSDGDETPAYLQVLEENVAEVRSRLDRSTNGLSFQASVIGAANKDFTVAFSIPAGQLTYTNAEKTSGDSTVSGITAKGNGLVEAAVTAIGGIKNRNMQGFDRMASLTLNAGSLKVDPELLHEASNTALDLGSNTTSVTKTAIPSKEKSLSGILSAIEKPGKMDETLLSGEKLTGEHCVGAREFMAYKQLPDDPLVQNELKDPKKMVAANWNYKTLRAKYDKLMAMGKTKKMHSKPEILLLKAKLRFLERNPMFKTFLAADSADLKQYYEAKGITDPTAKADVLKKYEKIDERKAELMEMLSKLTPPPGCDSAECLFKMSQSSEMQEVKKKVRDFFANPLNAQLTQTENDKQGLLEAANFLNDPEKAFTARPKNYSMSSVENAFARTYGLGKPSDCSKNKDMSVDTCFRIYAAWCVELNEKQDLIREQSRMDPALVDDLDESMKNYFETDPKINIELGDFNKAVCETKRRTSDKASPESYKSFAEYSKEKCASNSSLCDSNEKIENMRIAYLNEYKVPMVGNEKGDLAILGFNAFIMNGRVKNMSSADAQNMIANRPSSFSMDSFNRINEEWGFRDNIMDAPSSKVAGNNAYGGDAANASATVPKVDNKFFDSTPQVDPASLAQSYNYSSAAKTSTLANSELPKVENMTDPQRQQLMDDWQKEYDAWKKNKSANDGSPAASANESAMQARIQALEQLLAQQKKLTEDQYKLLNDAIANQNKGNNVVASNQEGNSSSSSGNGRNRSTSAITGSNDEEEVVSRGPASIANQSQQSTAGSKSGGAGQAGVGSGGPSGSRRVSAGGTSDDVAREEAKLVNVRGNSDGSIIISAVNNNSGSGANAISVPVSDDQYRALQANPQSLNLSQIEKSIPKDQIAKLEKDGEIVILLRNGSNPPFEVKVERKNNKLVYSLKDKNGKDQAPVRRVFTRQALELQLKANR